MVLVVLSTALLSSGTVSNFFLYEVSRQGRYFG